MTDLRNTAEGGTDGTAVTVANSGGGSGDAWNGAAVGMTFRAAGAYRGTLSYAYVQADPTLACYSTWTDTASDSCAIRFYLKLLEYPTATIQGPLNVRGAAAMARLNMNTTGQMSITVVNGATSNTGGFSASALALNTWYRIEYTMSGAGTASTNVTTNVYLADNAAAAFTVPAVTGVSTGEQITTVRYGRNNAAGSNNWLLDDARQVFGTAAELGPSASGSAGTDQVVEPGAPVTLVATGTGSWAQTVGTSVQLYDGQGLTAPAANVAAWSALWDAIPITGPGTGTGGWLGGDGCWSVTHPTGQSTLFTFGDSPVSRVQTITQLGTSAAGQSTATDRLVVLDAQAWKFSVGGRVQVFQSDGTTPRYGSTIAHTIASMNSGFGFTNLNLTAALPSAPTVGDIVKGVTGGTETAFPNSSAVLWTKRRGLQLVTGLGTFIPNDAGQSATWYWAGPMVVDSDGALYCFPSKQLHGAGAAYTLLGRGIFRYAWPNAWQAPSDPVKVADMTSPILWGAAACADGSFNYIYGTYKPTSNDFSFNVYLARCPRGGLSRDPASWEFWTPSGWLPGSDALLTDPDRLAVLISYGADTFQGVENTLSAHNLGGSFKLTSKKGGSLAGTVAVWDADAVTGPYVVRTVGSAPYGSPTANDQTYLTNGHFNVPPMGDGNYLVSVSQNRTTLTTTDYLAGSAFYRPKWFAAAANGGTYTSAPAGDPKIVQFLAPQNSTAQQVLTFTFGATTVNVTVLAPTERMIRNGVEVPVITRSPTI